MFLKIFPHILCRITALPFDELQKLNLSAAFLDLMEKQRVLEVEFEKIKSDILTDLKTYDATFSEFSTIRKLKKQLHKNRILSSPTLQSGEKDFKKTFYTTPESCATYNDLLNKKNQITQTLEIEFEKEKLRIQTELQTLSQNTDFQNALPLSSLSFAKNLDNYWRKKPSDFRKKELQTEQTVMQYIVRMAAKTSPFSSFTKVSSTTSSTTLQSGEKEYKTFHTTLESGCTFNNFLLQLFQTLFISNTEISNYLKIQINSTLEKSEKTYRILVNRQNVEAFQEIEIEDILELVETIFVDKSQLAKVELLDLLENEIEAERLELLGFVDELLEIGFLEIDFGFHGHTENWLQKVCDFVERTPVFDDFDVEFFKNLEMQLIDFGNGNMQKRISILENTHRSIALFFKKYGFKDNLKAILSPEQLIYEDVATTETPNFEAKAIEKLVFSLHELLEKNNFLKGKERLQIEYFFNQFYDENAIVPLLDFYENYFKIGKQIKETEIPAIVAEAELLRNWAKAVGEMVLKKYEIDKNVELKISDFEQINEALNIQTKPLKGLSLACFAQMYSEENELKAVLNGVTLGYGKMTGRFLKLMPKEFTEDLRQFNAELEKEILMADNVDASFFNANMHPPLLKYEISMPESQNQLPKNRQLNVQDLAIRKIDNEIVLWHLKLEKTVQVFDLGIQTPKGRSPLYQLLMNFSPIVPDLKYLKEAIEVAIPQNGKNYIVFPRIIFKNWVLFRKSWIFQDWEILNKIKNEGTLNGIQSLKKALVGKKIGNKFYIKKIGKPSTKDSQNRKKNKPTYIDVNNVILNNIFLKYIDNESFVFEISEILPSNENLLKIKERPFYIENILQWYN